MAEQDAARDKRLRELIASHRTLASGHLRLLSLDRLSLEMGEKWSKRSDHIRYTIESAIRRHLRRGQTFYRSDEHNYVIVFDFDEQDRADYVCRAISREVLQRLLGESSEAERDLAIELRIAQITGAAVRNDAAPTSLVQSALASAPARRLTLPKEYGAELVATPVGDVSGTGSDDSIARSAAKDLKGMVDLGWRSIESRLADGGASAPERKDETSGPIDFSYRPYWSPKARAFLISRICGRVILPGRNAPNALDATIEVEDGDVLRSIDRLVLGQAIIDLKRHLAAGHKYLALVPLHAASFMGPQARAGLLDLLSPLSDPLPKLVALELVDPHNISWADLVPGIWQLRAACRRMVLRQSFGAQPWVQTQHLPGDAIGLSVGLPKGIASEAQAIERMNAFMVATGKQGCETLIDGLTTRSLAFGAIGAGFDHVAGPAIAVETQDPTAAQRAQMDAVFL